MPYIYLINDDDYAIYEHFVVIFIQIIYGPIIQNLYHIIIMIINLRDLIYNVMNIFDHNITYTMFTSFKEEWFKPSYYTDCFFLINYFNNYIIV